jgi:hypothetical protein
MAPIYIYLICPDRLLLALGHTGSNSNNDIYDVRQISSSLARTCPMPGGWSGEPNRNWQVNPSARGASAPMIKCRRICLTRSVAGSCWGRHADRAHHFRHWTFRPVSMTRHFRSASVKRTRGPSQVKPRYETVSDLDFSLPRLPMAQRIPLPLGGSSG